ncbi:substrate-binding domain-containing protein [Roseixanthobacter liquoris]|uniref:substrate-binding domain-containing protein n=1 Tax=Roseixanthobacter liquoris TaxID=3119921 RepID=UPI0037281B41
MFRQLVLTAAFVFAYGAAGWAADLNVYGPGGPLPAMKEAAEAFGRQKGIDLAVTAGPTPSWIERARTDADIIFSGSESMMTDFVSTMNGQIRSENVEPLYLRRAAILVRPGNPKKIQGLGDLAKPGMKVLVVHGAGQTGLWEDVAGRTGDIASVRNLRANIGTFAANSAVARKTWTEDAGYDAWLIWNIWQVSNPALADIVEIDDAHRIWRDAGVVLTERARQKPAAAAFVAFLKSGEGAAIFRKWGWTTP